MNRKAAFQTVARLTPARRPQESDKAQPTPMHELDDHTIPNAAGLLLLSERQLLIALTAECEFLKTTMKYDSQVGLYYWPHVCEVEEPEGPSECGICTNGAKLIAKKFGGFVAGYRIHPTESRTLIAADVYGHDFAVIGDYIVDWWAWEYDQSLEKPVIRRAEGIALGKYKPEFEWVVLAHNDFRSAVVSPVVDENA